MKLLVFVTLLGLAMCDEELKEFSLGNREFTAKFYGEIIRTPAFAKKSFVFSPISVEVILALTHAGTRGQTADEFTTALNLPSSHEKTHNAIKKFLPNLTQNRHGLSLSTANKIFVQKGFNVKPTFSQIASDVFKSSTDNVDFSQKEQAAQHINQWVEGQTNNKIKDLIQPESLDASTKLVLVNALHFKGQWQVAFEKYLTQTEKFYTSENDTKQVKMMHTTETFGYFEDSSAQYLELPYYGEHVRMIVILPKAREGLTEMEKDIRPFLTPKEFKWERVDVALPKFNVEFDSELSDILKNLGLKTVFTTAGDLSGISDQPLLVNKVVQKAFIDVNEDGTEAAAATAVRAVGYSLLPDPDPKIHFIADHPFLYGIYHDDVVLFAGRVSDF